MAKVMAGERPGFGEEVAEPVYLVCTNGRHDRCCATYGRPLALALADQPRGAGLGELPRRRRPVRRQPGLPARRPLLRPGRARPRPSGWSACTARASSTSTTTGAAASTRRPSRPPSGSPAPGPACPASATSTWPAASGWRGSARGPVPPARRRHPAGAAPRRPDRRPPACSPATAPGRSRRCASPCWSCPGRGHGPAAAGEPVGPGGGRPLRLRRPLALCGRGGRRGGRGGDGELRPHRAGRSAGAAAPLGRSGSDLPGHLRRSRAEWGWLGSSGCWTRRRWRTRSPPRTPSRCCGARSGGCCGPARRSSRPRSGACWCARTTMPRRASRPVTGPTGPLVRSWWTRWSGTPTGPTMPCGGSGWTHGWPRRRRCWPPSPAKTSKRPTTAASGSSRGPRLIGSSAPSTRRPATATRPPRAAMTATRRTSRWILIARSSARRR